LHIVFHGLPHGIKKLADAFGKIHFVHFVRFSDCFYSVFSRAKIQPENAFVKRFLNFFCIHL